MGKLLPGPKALRLDMDISADRIAWEELTELFETESKAGNRKGSLGIPLPPVEGTLRLKADHFTIAGLSSNPLQATASLSPNGIKGEIQQANVCGVGTSGKVNFIDGEIALDLSLAVTDGQLQPTSLCLTHNRHAMTGSYTLGAHITGQGAPEKLLANLRGGFEFRARDGAFSPSGTADTALETIFDYLNEKGDLGVAFPDLDRESFPFRSLRVLGTLDGMTLVNHELAIQSTLYVISGNGKRRFRTSTDRRERAGHYAGARAEPGPTDTPRRFHPRHWRFPTGNSGARDRLLLKIPLLPICPRQMSAPSS